MDVNLAPGLRDEPAAQAAAGLVSRCVHCGFCTAACPTYGLDRDERDSPRGRIYLVKAMLEGHGDPVATAHHLDRCLTCRSCETACPSGVEYARIAHFGRRHAAAAAPPPLARRVKARLVATLAGNRPAGRLARLAARVAAQVVPAGPWRGLGAAGPALRDMPAAPQADAPPVTVFAGCAQEAMMPASNQALMTLLRLAGLAPRLARAPRCCGALAHHLGQHRRARRQVNQVLAALAGATGAPPPPVIVAASGCASFLREYPHLDCIDPPDLPAARRVAAAVTDPATVLGDHLATLQPALAGTVAGIRAVVHRPCTQAHGMRTPAGQVPELLAAAGYTPLAAPAAPNCCGSAGAHSLMQPGTAARLRTAMAAALDGPGPAVIATANIGCALHLRLGTMTPVHHWAELLAARPRPRHGRDAGRGQPGTG